MELIKSDCLDALKKLPQNSIDSLITDPPAGISFMGKSWDDNKGGRDQWITWLTEVMVQCMRVMKPGAHGLVWALPRTSHWTATALENAGFEVRDVVTHLFGSGFPKSHDVSKGIDKQAGATREVVGEYKRFDGKPAGLVKKMNGGALLDKNERDGEINMITAPTTPETKQWEGWGTALKPASEHWILVRKPCSEKTVAANVIKYGTGGINIDACRIGPADPDLNRKSRANRLQQSLTQVQMTIAESISNTLQGRFPANLIFSHSEYCTDIQCDIECAIKKLDEQSIAGGMHSAGKQRSNQRNISGEAKGLFPMHDAGGHRLGDFGGASRFFYCAKASKSEKNAGLEGMPEQKYEAVIDSVNRPMKRMITGMVTGERSNQAKANFHPTVKATKLMQYLIKLITPVNGTVLDPFMGSGSTGVAAKELDFDFIGIEKEADYFQIAEKRINGVNSSKPSRLSENHSYPCSSLGV